MTSEQPSSGQPPSPVINTSVPHSARIWNYWLGGKDFYPVDRQVGDQIAGMYPGIFPLARADRAFLGRAVHYLAGEAGVRQFLDIGTGLPTADNTHQVAQRVAPESKVVYVDNDPLVLVHARALLTSSAQGKTDYIEADVHDPETILRGAGQTLDLTQPVALMLLGVLNFVLGDDEGYTIVRRLMDALPSGSYLAVTHPTSEIDAERYLPTVDHWNKYGEPKMRTRTRAEIACFFDGLELLDPGVVMFMEWRPETIDIGELPQLPGLCGLARKP
ncbi:MAG TPA: SAM-dependent methyltransferase [Streptosporangiaceae bacterium]|nr:SAM-dependent methyltransferase [Streptosporangiaceae bacterium]